VPQSENDSGAQSYTVENLNGVGVNYLNFPAKDRLQRSKAGTSLLLEQKSNQHHDNAIAIYLSGSHTQVGWVARKQADFLIGKYPHLKNKRFGAVLATAVSPNSYVGYTVQAQVPKNRYTAEISNANLYESKKLGDKGGKYKISSLDEKLTFGRHQSEVFGEIDDTSYVQWMLGQRMISKELFKSWMHHQGISEWEIDDDDEEDCDDMR